MSNFLLECQSLTKRFGHITAANQVDLQLHPQEFLALLGPSGCGKSTILRMIGGFEAPDQGSIFLHNQTVANEDGMVPPEYRPVGMVFQDLALFPHLTVGKNIAFGLKGEKEEKEERIHTMLELVGLPGTASKMPHMLSGGEQQRVAVARALAPSPQLILLDEPFSSLDQQLRIQLRYDIREILSQEQVSAIFVTHDQEDAFAFADRVMLLRDGTVIQTGTSAEIYHYPCNPWVASFVGEANFLPFNFGKTLMNDDALHNEFPPNCSPESCELMIRPEDWSVKPADSIAHGMIQHIEFSGDQQVLKIEVASYPIQVRVPSRESWRSGAGVELAIEHCLVFPK